MLIYQEGCAATAGRIDKQIGEGSGRIRPVLGLCSGVRAPGSRLAGQLEIPTSLQRKDQSNEARSRSIPTGTS